MPRSDDEITMTNGHFAKIYEQAFKEGYAFATGVAADKLMAEDAARSAGVTLAAREKSRLAIIEKFPDAFRLSSNGNRPGAPASPARRMASDAAPRPSARPDFPNGNRLRGI